MSAPSGAIPTPTVRSGLEFVITPAEVRRDTGRGGGWARKDVTREELHVHDYAPTTLVMVFPAGELADLRRLIWGDQ